jgi:acetyl esterase/lipase
MNRSARKALVITSILFSVIFLNTDAAVNLNPGVDHRVKEFLDKFNANGPKIETLSPKDARAVLTKVQASVSLKLPAADIVTKTIQVDGAPLELLIVRPPNTTEILLPVFMFFHGGGWVLGDFPTHERLVRDLVTGSGAAAVFVNYTPSPEAPYPVAINQAYAATKWIAENGQEVGVNGKCLAVAGNSAGGNIATVVSLMAKEKKTPDIKFQVLMFPVTDANFNTKSYDEFADGYLVSKSLMKWFWDNYTPDPKQRKEVYASPLQATPAQLKGLPPALVITAEFDPLRDEGQAFARQLDAAGVDVTSIQYNGMVHDFALLNALNLVPGTHVLLRQISNELKEHLNCK